MTTRIGLSTLPLSNLLSTPLEAASDAQVNSVKAMLEAMYKFGFENGKTRTIDVVMERPYVDSNGTLQNHEVAISVPLLSFAVFQQLQIDELSLEFTIELVEKDVAGSATDEPLSEPDSERATLHGRMAAPCDNLRKTSSAATYNVKLKARGVEVGEGWKKLGDILCSTVEPNYLSPQE